MNHTNSKKKILEVENLQTPVKVKVDNAYSGDIATKKKTMPQSSEKNYQINIKSLQDKIKLLQEQNIKTRNQMEKKIYQLMKEKNVLEVAVAKLKEKDNPKQNNTNQPKIKSISTHQLMEIDNTVQLQHLKKNLTQANKQVDQKRQQLSKLRRDNTQLIKMLKQNGAQIDKLKLQNNYLNKAVNTLKRQLLNRVQGTNSSSHSRERSHSSSRNESAQKDQKRKNDLKRDQNSKQLQAQLHRANNKVKILGQTIELINEQIVKNNILDLNVKYRNAC